ncbi:MAG TPA: phosphopantetheine-binding protein [Dongiaceae bacterium]|nr:phosphopantetheine-binding protein [Dongiaceae bacterium]
MTRDDIRKAVIEKLGDIAPETDPAALKEDADVRDALDIDSMDFLNFVTALHRDLHVDIPEADYPKLLTIGGAVAYLAAKSV